MQYLWSRIPGGNFGDNLNGLLWEELMAGIGPLRPHQAVYGIGSFEDIVVPERVAKVHVMGSGFTGQSRGRTSCSGNVQFHLVRGPRSAAAWGCEGTELADGAVMLAHSHLWHLPADPTTHRVGYVPHHISDEIADFGYICEKAGVRHLATKGYDVEGFIRQMKSCDCIITEALHGAIVADLLRKPWKAVSSRLHINAYKWSDWCESVGIAYLPQPVDFVCSRGLRPCDRALNAVKRCVSALGLGKEKWRHKRVLHDGRREEDRLAGQILAVKQRADYVLSPAAIRDRMIEQTLEALTAFKQDVAA